MTIVAGNNFVHNISAFTLFFSGLSDPVIIEMEDSDEIIKDLNLITSAKCYQIPFQVLNWRNL